MNIPSWLPFFKKTEDDEPAQSAPKAPSQPQPTAEANAQPESPPIQPPQGIGAVTGRRLDQLSSLCRPFVTDPFYRLRPPFSHQAAELSLELAQMTYSLDIDPWRVAGWNDFSIQIDNTLQSGLTHSENATGERMQAIINAWKLHRARAALSERNPVSQLMSTLRQRERSDTIKAVSMMHPLDDGHFVLAIGFMGTGKRLYDWISNFRFTTEEGFHKGFCQLCSYFEQGAESIVFPTTAQTLGLEKLTLGQVLSEMRSGSSRFHLWMAGHSQGAAVMQVFAHRLITQWGVLPQNLVGYGFASPTVATDKFVYDPASYPLYHIINSDDMVPRMGALVHLGLCMNYPAGDDLRQKTYYRSSLEADSAIYDALTPYKDGMTDVERILVYSTAFVQTLAEEKGEESLNALMDKPWAIPMVDKLFLHAGDRMMGWVEAFLHHLHNGYADLMGRPMDEAELALLRESMRPLVRENPMRRLMAALASHMLPPHHLVRRDGEGAYAYIVNRDLNALQPFIWVKQPDGLPIRRYAQVTPQALKGAATALPTVHRRKPKPATRRAQPMGVRRRSYGVGRA